MTSYLITVTDLFGGEANFSWVRRYETESVSQLGAVQKLAKHTGASWRRESSDRYDSGGICAFVEEMPEEYPHKTERI